MSLVEVAKKNDEITEIVLNRPEKRNALSIALMKELLNAIQNCRGRIMILRGAGPLFCAGLDLGEVSREDLMEESAELISLLLNALSTSSLISIAAVHGKAVAGGAGILAACDFAIVAEGTTIGYTETRLGLVAAIIMPYLMRRLRFGELTELLLGAEMMGATRAKEIGLVNQVVTDDRLVEASYHLAETICLCAPKATQMTKALMHSLIGLTVEEMEARVERVHRTMRLSEEAKIGTAAFAKKIRPKWN